MAMHRLTMQEAAWLMELLREKYGFGYSDVEGIGKLQAKLSIMAELGRAMGDPAATSLPEKTSR